MKKLFLFVSIIYSALQSSGQRMPLTENFLTNVGDSVIVMGKIYGGAFLTHVQTKPTFLNLGDTSPNHRLVIRIEPEDRDKFPSPPETFFLNKVVRVSGKLQEYKGAPLIRISEPGMIKETSTNTDAATIAREINNGFTATGPSSAASITPQVITPSLRMIVPDSVLQTAWIKSVAEKATDDKKRNVRMVQKEMDLRTAPFNDAPVIAELKPGLLVSILYTSKKWSYISIGSIDGFNNVSGFIRHKKFRHLKKP